MLSYLLTILGFVFVALWSTTGVQAESYESPDAIRAAVEGAVMEQSSPGNGETLQFEVGYIDSRIHVAACGDMAVDVPTTKTPYMSARVSCRTPFWTLYVPVRVHDWAPAVVAATNLAPGTRLTAADLTVARLDILTTNGAYLTDPRQAEGMILRANVRAGAPILAPLLDRPIIVHRGDTVVLTVLDGPIIIRTSAIAAEDGRAGDRILVENPDSRKSVRASVADAGSVEIRFDQRQRNY